ncbi:hypothetical protein LPJ64_001725 [Coemansia asiatica]|uniref:FHA domain-containing protein n=1 Tax=Coemansia asiatica TaxID=1052880 RepID=A0A9W8CKC8_9FUNG|nr:hypothetical protein LPJ64_001725 [Coemansia asiatica]
MSRSPTDRKRRRSPAVRRRRSVSVESSGREQRRRRAQDDDDSHGHSTDSRRTDRHRSSVRTTRRRSRTEGSATLAKRALSSPPSSDGHGAEAGRQAHRRHASSSAKMPALAESPSEHREQRQRKDRIGQVPAKTPVSAAAAATTTPSSSSKVTKAADPAPASPPEAYPPEASPKAPAADDAVDFGLSGKLAAEANTVNGVVLKYAEPPEARKPRHRWRIYVFKDAKDIDMHHIDSASAYLFGRDRKASINNPTNACADDVADIPIDHPSCSSQHAVLQYRQTDPKTTRPYIIDLNSTNGTFLNGDKLPIQRYVELRSEDVIRFGFSTREYVVLREK